MKILSYGHVKPKQQFCGGCGATYEYVPRDIETLHAGTSHAKNFVRCPVCGHAEWITETLVKHEKYVTFQTPTRHHDILHPVDGKFTDRLGKNYYTFRVTVKIGFDGPQIGDSLTNMVIDSVRAVFQTELARYNEPFSDYVIKDIAAKAQLLTNMALRKITVRADVQEILMIAICPTQKVEETK